MFYKPRARTGFMLQQSNIGTGRGCLKPSGKK